MSFLFQNEKKNNSKSYGHYMSVLISKFCFSVITYIESKLNFFLYLLSRGISLLSITFIFFSRCNFCFYFIHFLKKKKSFCSIIIFPSKYSLPIIKMTSCCEQDSFIFMNIFSSN